MQQLSNNQCALYIQSLSLGDNEKKKAPFIDMPCIYAFHFKNEGRQMAFWIKGATYFRTPLGVFHFHSKSGIHFFLLFYLCPMTTLD